ncbi:hypothetical protein LguiA_009706 [Lonicera macranthoides]
MEGDDHRDHELQLLPTPHNSASSSSRATAIWPSDSSSKFDGPSLDLQLSISLRPMIRPQLVGPTCDDAVQSGCLEALKWQATEQIRLAAMEKAYAERVREMSRREMELAQSEFSRARHMWERAREEVEKAEKMKERASRRIDSACMEITCQSCRQKFRV